MLCHELTVAEADAARGLHLPDVHGLYAGTNDLGDVGAAVDAHGNDTCGKTRKVRDPRNVRQREADHGKSVENKHELHHQGRPADELDVSDRQPLERQNFAHAHTGHERAEDRAEKHGECGDDERIDNAFLKKAVIADDELSDQETLLIGRVGQAMGVELEKIEQISNWIIDRIIWLEQAKIIFEEVK